nr:protein R11G11.11 [imported] - Caenorhabditis elegans [Caenorhabditis elegans]
MFLFTVLLPILMSKRILTSHLGLFKTTSSGVVLGLKSSLRANSIATKPKMGYILMSVVFFNSFLIQGAWQYGAKVAESPIMNSLQNCAEHQDLKNLPRFKLDIRQFSEKFQILIIQLYIASDVIVSQLLPSSSFPIITALLLRELRKLHKFSPTLQRNGVVEDHEEKYGLPTKLITLLTIMSLLSDAPLGFIEMTKTFLQQGTALIRFLTDLMIYFNIFSTAVSIFRPIRLKRRGSQIRQKTTYIKITKRFAIQILTKKQRLTPLCDNNTNLFFEFEEATNIFSKLLSTVPEKKRISIQLQHIIIASSLANPRSRTPAGITNPVLPGL